MKIYSGNFRPGQQIQTGTNLGELSNISRVLREAISQEKLEESVRQSQNNQRDRSVTDHDREIEVTRNDDRFSISEPRPPMMPKFGYVLTTLWSISIY